MAEVPSTFALKPGERAPDFSLPDPDGTIHSLRDLIRGQKGLLIAFVCNHCPFVIHLAKELGRTAASLAEKGIVTVAINANDATRYPADSPEKMVAFAAANGWNFPYLYDETQEVAKAYKAACTPDFFVFDKDQRLVYRGRLDSSRPDTGVPLTGQDMRAALDAILAGKPVSAQQRPSIGCNIKWKPGGEPSYF